MIQRCCRGWLARRRAAVLRSIKAERDGFLAAAAAEHQAAAQLHKRCAAAATAGGDDDTCSVTRVTSAVPSLCACRREVERRTQPLTHADFALLAGELETWRQQQTATIKASGLEHVQQQVGSQCSSRRAVQQGGRQCVRCCAASAPARCPVCSHTVSLAAVTPTSLAQAALQLLLAKETRLLQTLDRLHINARHENKALHTQQQLGSLSQPKTWALTNGKQVNDSSECSSTAAAAAPLHPTRTRTLASRAQVLVHVPQTVRAAELHQLYNALTLETLTLDERLDVLLHVKWAARAAADSGLARELVELIDREADLLNRWPPAEQRVECMHASTHARARYALLLFISQHLLRRGRSPATLDGLRRRIAAAFLQLCRSPSYNPEAARLRLVPGGPGQPEAWEHGGGDAGASAAAGAAAGGG